MTITTDTTLLHDPRRQAALRRPSPQKSSLVDK